MITGLHSLIFEWTLHCFIDSIISLRVFENGGASPLSVVYTGYIALCECRKRLIILSDYLPASRIVGSLMNGSNMLTAASAIFCHAPSCTSGGKGSSHGRHHGGTTSVLPEKHVKDQ